MGLIGYARVSTAEGRQVLDRQLDALNDAGDFAFDEAFQVSHNFACCSPCADLNQRERDGRSRGLPHG